MGKHKKYIYATTVIFLSLQLSSCVGLEENTISNDKIEEYNDKDIYSLRYENDFPIKEDDYIIFPNTITEPDDINIDKEYSKNGPTLIEIHSDFKKILYSQEEKWSLEEVNMESLSPDVKVTQEKEDNIDIRDYRKGFLSNIVKGLKSNEDRPISIRQEIWINKDKETIEDFSLEKISYELAIKHGSKLYKNRDSYEFEIFDGENIYTNVLIKKYHIYDRNLDGIEEDEKPYFEKRNNRDCIVLETVKYVKRSKHDE